MCFIMLLLNSLLFFSNWITPTFSCLILASYPKGFNEEFMLVDLICDLKKFFVPVIDVTASPTPMSSDPVKHLLLIFCFVDINNTLPFTKIRQAPV